MKIIFVTSTLTSGGSERVISLLANELSMRGHIVSIALLREPMVFYPLSSNIKLHFAQEHSNNILKKILWLRHLVKTEKYDVAIPFMTAVYCTTIFALLGIKCPVISSERIDPRYSPVIRSFARWLMLRFTTHLVVQTNYIKEFYSNSIQERTTVIPNPVLESVFTLDGTITPFKRIISVGRLYEQKNQKMMIDAFASIATKYPEYKLVIFGEGPLREDLTKHINDKGMKDRILLPGRSTKIIDELQASEIFCLSSDYEGMSNALLEAMCIGLPIITTKVSGVEDMLVNNTNAFIVNVGDVTAMTSAMDKLIANPEIRNKFSVNNKRLAVNYSLGRIVDKWEDLILKIAGNKSGGEI